jgi:Fe(3+) dicitrate transport protein
VRDNEVEAWIPGFGASWAANQRWTVFGGVHKGFSPPGPGLDEGTRPEESINFEAGARFAAAGFTGAVVGFYNDYDNLLGTDTLSSGGTGTGDQFNGGAVTVQGVELSLAGDLGRRFDWRYGLPIRAAYTYTSAEFDGSFETSFADWAPEVQEGDEVPYVPPSQWSLSVGLTDRRWAVHTTLSYSDAMRTSAGQGPIPVGEGTEEHLVVDLAADWNLFTHLRLYAQVRNLTDESYVAARRPAGLRPGLPRTALLGVSWEIARR